jgi:hypothetical protein
VTREQPATSDTPPAATPYERLMHFPPGEPCASCAIRSGSDANCTPETIEMLKDCIANGEPFYCHESTAERDDEGFSVDRHGNRYRRLPFARWRLCRGWTRAVALRQVKP